MNTAQKPIILSGYACKASIHKSSEKLTYFCRQFINKAIVEKPDYKKYIDKFLRRFVNNNISLLLNLQSKK